MTCKDCLHYEACKGTYDILDATCSGEFDYEEFARSCKYFTNRSEWVHLPCRLNLPKELYRYMFDDDYNKIVVKCKVGEVTGYGFELIHYDGRRWKYGYDRIGKTVFLTREEAEEALEGMKEDG